MSGRADRRVFEFGGFVLDVAERVLVGPDGAPRALTGRPMALLVFLLERPDRLLTKDDLMAGVWRDVVVDESSLSQTIASVRRALGETGRERRHIETAPGVGYRFIGPVHVRSAGPEAAESAPSIAVLPFEDLSAGQDQRYLADGVAEEILDRFAHIAGLRTIARASSFVFRGRREHTRAIGAELGATHLLTGAVRKDAERLRVSAQLVDAASGAQEWAETFDRRTGDIFAIQDEIAAAVAAAVRLKMAGARPKSVETANPEAHDLYLRGRAAALRLDAENLVRGMELHRQALALDPEFALAWIGVAEAAHGALMFAPHQVDSAFETLREATDKAVELSPDYWGSWVAQARRFGRMRDWRRSFDALDAAARLAPGRPWELAFTRGTALLQVGRVREAVDEMRAASRDDPLTLLASSVLQYVLHCAGRDEEAETEYQRSLDLPGGRDMAEHIALHRASCAGDPAREEAALRRFIAAQTMPIPMLDRLPEVFDQPDKARAVLREAVARQDAQFPLVQITLAWRLARYGDVEAALRATRRATVELSGGVTSWLWVPVFAEMRRAAGFKGLLAELGLVDFWRETGDWGDFCRPLGDDDFVCS